MGGQLRPAAIQPDHLGGWMSQTPKCLRLGGEASRPRSWPATLDGPRRVSLWTDPVGRGREFQDGGVSFRAGRGGINERRGADWGGACARVRCCGR